MAYKKKTKSGYSVHQGNTGKKLKTFSGKNAEKKACDLVRSLHKKHNPKKSNRGAAAKKKNS